ncbi:MAG: SRPBCC domain-containing protein [Polyangia bacterium]|jgi:uncharacterized protein YndB with AHSA1/START domain
MTTPITIERTFAATPEQLWDLWTTKAGIESWWGPDGFTVEVLEHDLRPGGRLHYTMTATAPETVAFMKQAGLPLGSHAHATFGEIEHPRFFSYESLIDFVPGVAPYSIQNRIDLIPVAGGTKAVTTVDPLHDDEWTNRIRAGRASQLDKLERLLAKGGAR